jgi:hypothetical protein
VKAIGLRAEKMLVRFVVLDGDARKRVDNGKLELGERGSFAKELSLLRTALLNVLKLYKPDCCGMRLSDNPQSKGIIQSLFTRARIEGVCMEAIAEFGIPLTAGTSVTIKAKMHTKKPLREYASVDEIRGIDLTGRGQKNVEYRDAVIAALAALGG